MRVNQSGTMGGTGTSTMTYTYLGDGTRAAARAGAEATSYAGKRYRGTFVYDVTAGGVQSLESVAVSTGRLIALTGTNGAVSFESDGFITDHLGNVAVVVNLSASSSTSTNNAILEQNEYTPFGTKLNASGLKSQAANRWRYAGKEEQDIAGMNLRLLDFGARYYDSFTCRWNAVDPLAHKYFPMSPYNYCGNDPVNKFDPDGRDIFVFDAEGKYVETIEDDGEDYIQWNRVDSEGNEYVMNVSFVDPQNDPQKINKNTLLIAMSNDQIREIIEGQGGFSCSTSDFIKESVGGGNFDYSVSVLSVYSNGAIEYDSTGSRKSSGNEMTSPALFIPEGQNYAHNLMNFGNFLWGATGCSLGISTTVLKAGAHGNSIINSAKNGYRPQMDSEDDQRSIKLGAEYAKSHHYAK